MKKSPKMAKVLPLGEFSKILSSRLGRKVTITSAEKVSSGFLSDGFKLTLTDGTNYFLKRFKKDDLSGYAPEAHLASYVLSNAMMGRSGLREKGMWVGVQNENEVRAIPDITNTSVLYHIQPHKELGQSYWSMLENRHGQKSIGRRDKKEIALVVNLLKKIHGGVLPKNKKVRTQMYNEGIQAILGPLFFMFLHELPKDHHVLPHSAHARHIGKMVTILSELRDRQDRLRTLHGDFWGGNVFFDGDTKVEVIDFSRTPFGDPALDVAYWLGQYIWFYCRTGNPYYKELGNYFLDMYEKKSGDHEIRRAIALPFGLLGLVYTSKLVFPDAEKSVQKRFYRIVDQALTKKKFEWK